MTTDKQDGKDKWERKRVQRVLDYHNKKYGTHIEIEGKSIVVHPRLKGQLNWDWVCYEAKTGDEIAVEVKQITREDLEAKSGAIYNVLHEIRVDLLGKLPGNFSLFVNIDEDYDFPFRKQPKNKQRFKKAVSELIIKVANKLNIGQKEDITNQIDEKLQFNFPVTVFFDLYKASNNGSTLVIERLVGGSPVPLENFQQLISHANEQLKVASVEETLLVVVEEDLNPTEPSEVAEAFKNINSASYSNIRHVYFIRGGEVGEIPLPLTL